MAKKTFRINASVVVPDPEGDRPAILRHNGTELKSATKGHKMIPPGEPVELDEKEGKALIAAYGEFKPAIAEPITPVQVVK